jgi:hypothetical protein
VHPTPTICSAGQNHPPDRSSHDNSHHHLINQIVTIVQRLCRGPRRGGCLINRCKKGMPLTIVSRPVVVVLIRLACSPFFINYTRCLETLCCGRCRQTPLSSLPTRSSSSSRWEDENYSLITATSGARVNWYKLVHAAWWLCRGHGDRQRHVHRCLQIPVCAFDVPVLLLSIALSVKWVHLCCILFFLSAWSYMSFQNPMVLISAGLNKLYMQLNSAHMINTWILMALSKFFSYSVLDCRLHSPRFCFADIKH